jgi:hypothetical protein
MTKFRPARTAKSALGALAAVLVLTSIAGCSETSHLEVTGDPEFVQLITLQLSTARAADVSAEQIALLERAAEVGNLEFEAYKQAVEATFQCFRDSEVRYQEFGIDNSAGFPQLKYMYESPPDGPSPVASQCVIENSRYVEMVYQVQPSSSEASDAAFEAALPVLIPCLREQGFLGPEDPTVDEVHDAIWAVFDHVVENPMTDIDPMMCPMRAGISNF